MRLRNHRTDFLIVTPIKGWTSVLGMTTSRAGRGQTEQFVRFLYFMNGWTLAPHNWRTHLFRPIRWDDAGGYASISIFGLVIFYELARHRKWRQQLEWRRGHKPNPPGG